MSKTPEQKKTHAIEAMIRLLDDCKTASLATTGSAGDPHVSYSPTAIDEDRRFYFFLSDLSEHTHNLRARPQLSLMLIEDESQSGQLFARNRLTVNGTATPIPLEHPGWAAASTVYRARFGKFFEQLSRLKDFHMFRIEPESARVIVGFGAAFEVQLPDWSSLQLVTGK